MLGGGGTGEVAQVGQNFRSSLEPAASQLADHEIVAPHLSGIQERRQSRVTSAEVIDPHRGVDEYHRERRGTERRRGTARRCDSDPPRAARRWALSRLMSASSPARTRAVFWSIRVSRRASSRRSSSILSVVFIHMSMVNLYISCKAARVPRFVRDAQGPAPDKKSSTASRTLCGDRDGYLAYAAFGICWTKARKRSASTIPLARKLSASCRSRLNPLTTLDSSWA